MSKPQIPQKDDFSIPIKLLSQTLLSVNDNLVKTRLGQHENVLNMLQKQAKLDYKSINVKFLRALFKLDIIMVN